MCPPLRPVKLVIIVTRIVLKNIPKEVVGRQRPVVIAFIPLGALFVKKSNSPDNIKASSIPTKMNCGSKKKALNGRVIDLVMVPLLLAPTTENLLFSTSAAAAIPNMEKNNPSPTFCKFVKPEKGKKKELNK